LRWRLISRDVGDDLPAASALRRAATVAATRAVNGTVSLTIFLLPLRMYTLYSTRAACVRKDERGGPDDPILSRAATATFVNLHGRSEAPEMYPRGHQPKV